MSSSTKDRIKALLGSVDGLSAEIVARYGGAGADEKTARAALYRIARRWRGRRLWGFRLTKARLAKICR